MLKTKGDGRHDRRCAGYLPLLGATVLAVPRQRRVLNRQADTTKGADRTQICPNRHLGHTTVNSTTAISHYGMRLVSACRIQDVHLSPRVHCRAASRYCFKSVAMTECVYYIQYQPLRRCLRKVFESNPEQDGLYISAIAGERYPDRHRPGRHLHRHLGHSSRTSRSRVQASFC